MSTKEYIYIYTKNSIFAKLDITDQSTADAVETFEKLMVKS